MTYGSADKNLSVAAVTDIAGIVVNVFWIWRIGMGVFDFHANRNTSLAVAVQLFCLEEI